jgi:hypothetical protein
MQRFCERLLAHRMMCSGHGAQQTKGERKAKAGGAGGEPSTKAAEAGSSGQVDGEEEYLVEKTVDHRV